MDKGKIVIPAIVLFLLATANIVSANLTYGIQMAAEGASSASVTEKLKYITDSERVFYGSNLELTQSDFIYEHSTTFKSNEINTLTNYTYHGSNGIIVGTTLIENVGAGNIQANNSCRAAASGITANSVSELNTMTSVHISPYNIEHSYIIRGKKGGLKTGINEYKNTTFRAKISSAQDFSLTGNVEWSVPEPIATQPVPATNGLAKLCVWQGVTPIEYIFPIQEK
ncbi:MAG: hypothetical protein N2V75_03980 [Methanophagales archaeon]|nr:hypothetical protein [Methanophagales archaeon]